MGEGRVQAMEKIAEKTMVLLPQKLFLETILL
jgi:hypothetical protein